MMTKHIQRQVNACQDRNAALIYNLLIRQNTHQLLQSENPYLRQSAKEIEAVGDRVLSHLSGVGEKSTVQLDQSTVQLKFWIILRDRKSDPVQHQLKEIERQRITARFRHLGDGRIL